MLVFDLSQVDLLLPLRSLAHLGSLLLPVGIARPEFSSLAFDVSSLGFSLLLKSLGCVEPSPPPFGFVRSDSVVLVLDLFRLEPLLFVHSSA